jgi:hypothetical protein
MQSGEDNHDKQAVFQESFQGPLRELAIVLGALVKSKAHRGAAEAQAAHDNAALMFSRALPSLNSYFHESSVESVQATTLLVCLACVPIYMTFRAH